MLHKLICALCMMVALLGLSSCSEVDNKYYSSIDVETGRFVGGTWFSGNAWSEEVAMVIPISLTKRAVLDYRLEIIGDGNWISPSLSLTDREHIDFSQVLNKIYFVANRSIYTCNYSGGEVINLTQGITDTLSAVALSQNATKLTAISAGHINIFNRTDMQRTIVDNIRPAKYAVLNENQGKLYYYGTNEDYGVSLYSCDLDGSNNIEIFGLLTNAGYVVSTDKRYFCLYEWRVYGQSYTTSGMMKVYDTQTGVTWEIEKVYCAAFALNSSNLYYFNYSHPSTALYVLNLETNQTRLISDGIVNNESYLGSVRMIAVEPDQKKVHLVGNLKQDNSKGHPNTKP